MAQAMRHTSRADGISLSLVFRTLSAHRRQIARNMLLALLCAAVTMSLLPKRYQSHLQMVFEENSYAAKGLKSASTLLGVNIGRPEDKYDAFSPIQYQKMLYDQRLIGHLLFTEVTTTDGRKMLYGEYLRKANTPLTSADKDIMRPTVTLDSLVQVARKQLKLHNNARNGVLLVSAYAGDPRVCQQVCQSMGDYLFRFIRDYRIKKQKSEISHFSKVAEEQKRKYEAAKQALIEYSDSHWGTILPSDEKQKRQLSEEVLKTKQIYENVKIELSMSRARLQDITPAYIVVEHPAIPTEPSGLGKTYVCTLSALLALLYSLLYYMRNELWAQITR